MSKIPSRTTYDRYLGAFIDAMDEESRPVGVSMDTITRKRRVFLDQNRAKFDSELRVAQWMGETIPSGGGASFGSFCRNFSCCWISCFGRTSFRFDCA